VNGLAGYMLVRPSVTRAALCNGYSSRQLACMHVNSHARYAPQQQALYMHARELPCALVLLLVLAGT
jgi:hypothetical protein